MKAIVCQKYGPPHTLRLEEISQPLPLENEVLVKVMATTINDWDWSLVRGKPYLYRMFYGLLKPKKAVFGVELAGIVKGTGTGVTRFTAGDVVYGDISESGWGAWAEYSCVPEDALVHMPEGMSFEKAAALPHAAALAYQGLIDTGAIKKDLKILINGAGGGVGTIGLQIARTFNAEVTGVDSGEKLSMMKELGFDHVIDYKKEDFTRNGQRYDLVLDTKTTRPPLSYLRSLKPQGKYITVGGNPGRLLQLVFLKPWVALFADRSLHMVILKPNKDLTQIGQLLKNGKVNPVIDGPYSLEEIPQLLQYFGEGKHKGKIVISL